jgi:hypothetical protein
MKDNMSAIGRRWEPALASASVDLRSSLGGRGQWRVETRVESWELGGFWISRSSAICHNCPLLF